ncbi:MAG: threonine synthase [Hyphomonadaceae bacterium]|nr:threonine synthase [Hyphomonadaceae bacterium]
MLYVSTRGGGGAVTFSQALEQGLAPDKGLFVPQTWPKLNDVSAAPLIDVAERVIGPFFEGDALSGQLRVILEDAFTFPAPVTRLEENLGVIELFHGPTAAFKDFGARFLAACLARLPRDPARPLQTLVATSGDTGGAVAAAFHNRPGVKVTVLYPKGLVSPTQERQLTCWDNNVSTLAVRGTFDECQRLVKEAFGDATLRQRFELSSANSINIGRLLPQMTYFAASSAATRDGKVNIVIPSGNLGHATACVWAKKLGFPIGEIVLAHNANATMSDYLKTGEWKPRASVATLASAMDVGNPSNAERLRHLFPDLAGIRQAVTAYVIDDAEIREGISWGWNQYGQMWCPHTAAGAQAYRRRKAEGAEGAWLIASTAHPAKFSEIVEPIIGRPVPVPASLQALLNRPVSVREIDPTLAALVGAIA